MKKSNKIYIKKKETKKLNEQKVTYETTEITQHFIWTLFIVMMMMMDDDDDVNCCFWWLS